MHRVSKSLNELSRYDSLLEDRDNSVNFKNSWSFSNLFETDKDLTILADKTQLEEGVADEQIFQLPEGKAGLSLIERFQHKLASSVYSTLEKCGRKEGGEKETVETLEKLFYNISSKLDKSVADRLKLPRNDTYYFELLASYYGNINNAEVVQEKLLPLCTQLWSLELFPAVFAMIMHRWLLKYDGPEKKGGIIRFNVLLKGMNQLFWFDTKHRSHRLLSVFCYTKDKLLVAIPQRSLQQDFRNLLCRFYYYYRSSKVEKVREFLESINTDMDTFIRQNTNQLSAIENNHDMRIHYLYCLGRLSCMDFDQNNSKVIQGTTRNKLYSTLNALILPGAPFHPTIEERFKARETMDKLFPRGKWSRYAINLAFSLLRPLYWPSDLVHFCRELLDSIFHFFFQQEARAKTL